MAVAVAVTVGSAALLNHVRSNRSTAAMLLLLGILWVTTIGDWALSLLTAVTASLAFSWYFVDEIGSLRITSVQGGVTFLAMTLTALTGSLLSIRAQRQTRDANFRRDEMERISRFANSLLSANTTAELGDGVVQALMDVFRATGVRLRIDGIERVFEAGSIAGSPAVLIPIQRFSTSCSLEIYGQPLNEQMQRAVGGMTGLFLDRARNADAWARSEATQRGEALRSTVLNALAHDFKTPLTSIKAAASVLLETGRPVPAESQRELITVIDEEADRLDRLIRESLDQARLESHQASPRKEACVLAGIVGRVIRKMSRYAGHREVRVELSPDLPAIVGDPFLLEQMLAQVFDNALKYSAPGAWIRIWAEQRAANVVLSVQNEGSEIPASEISLIFEKFHRGNNGHSGAEGTGLGLSIAKTIAEAHDGRLWLENQPEGPTFCFELPASSRQPGGEDELHAPPVLVQRD